jgi:type I restriction enzyme, S subunit
VNEEQHELPRGWVRTVLSGVSFIQSGVGFPEELQGRTNGDLPFAKVGDISKSVLKMDGLLTSASNYVSFAEAQALRAKVFPIGTTLFAKIGEAIRLNRRAIAKVAVLADNNVMGLIPEKDLTIPEYLYYFMHTIDLYELSQATTVPSIRKTDVEQIKIPLPPLPEQQRIVAAIEQQFTRLDAAVAALKRAQIKLKRYRAAVLKAAVEGKLTEEWRAGHPATESASLLLERILKERRAWWEADLRAKGKDPAKVKYVEPAQPDRENLPELPAGWEWATVDQTAATEPNSITDGPFGSNLKTEHYRESGGRVIRLQNIGDGEFKDEKSFIALEHFETLRKHRVFAGDLAIAALGENPPRSCIIPDFVGPAIVKADCIRFKVSPSILNTFVNCVLNAEPTRKRTASQLHGIGRPRLNLTEIKSIVISLPPLTEQEQIVSEVERRLSIVSKLEATVEANLKRAKRLRQSILYKAFAGRLVPQDPHDEPASVLLERIRRERNGRTNGANNKKRSLQAPEPVKLDVTGAEQVDLWESVGD